MVVGYERYDKKGRDYTMMKANGWSLSEYFTVIITLNKYTHIEKKKNKEKREQMVIFVAWAERKKKTYVCECARVCDRVYECVCVCARL